MSFLTGKTVLITSGGRAVLSDGSAGSIGYAKNVHTPPMGYFGNPETDIGRVCVQLVHPDFKYLTGETLTLEGGLGLRP